MELTVGKRLTEEPDFKYTPPQEPEYQFQLAPELRFPPLILNDVVTPLHNNEGFAIADDAAVEFEIIVTVTSEQAVVLHEPDAFT